MEAPQPQISFLKDDSLGRVWALLPISHLILSLIAVFASRSQVLPLLSRMMLSLDTDLKLCHMDNPVAFELGGGVLTCPGSELTVTTLFIQQKILTC